MKSNGYGSCIQEIIVKVPLDRIDDAIRDLELEPFKRDDSFAYFGVHLTSTRRGDDETVMYEIDHLLSSIQMGTWKIDWDNSHY